MAANLGIDKNEERRKRVFVGKLPPDFLRISNNDYRSSQQQQEAADAQAAFALQHQLNRLPYSQNVVGRLSITVAQAKLVKNYGIARMNPYVKLRVGHHGYETPSNMSGGKTPKWNKVVHCWLPQGVNTIHLEVYDECSLKYDELIAWTDITIPQNVMNGETCDDWFLLSGKQGERVEGMINLVISFIPGSYGMYPFTSVLTGIPSATYDYCNSRPIPVTISPNPYPANPMRVPQLSAADLKQVEEMFPAMDKDVVKSVFEANGGNRDQTINSLLQMST